MLGFFSKTLTTRTSGFEMKTQTSNSILWNGGKKENMIGLDKAHSLNSKTSDSCNFVHM